MSPRISISLLGAQSDQRLLALARDGHERAFEALVQRYRRPLLRYCRRVGLAETRAEDVLQQAFLQAWLALARGVEVRELRPWLYRIVHNAAVNAMRGPAESHAELTEAVQAGASLAGESNLERMIAVREALGEVAELPLMQRQAIFLTAVDGQTHDEVASALGISHGALRGLLYRARTTLRSAAAALTPAQLLQWASGGTGAASPAAERVGELSAGGGAAGLVGVLLKGAVVAVSAGALATGAGVLAGREHGIIKHPHAVAAATHAAALRSSGADWAGGRASPILAPAELRPARDRRRGDGHRDARSKVRGADRADKRDRGSSVGRGRGEESASGRDRSGEAREQDGGVVGDSSSRGASSSTSSTQGVSAGSGRGRSSSEDRGTGASGSSGRDDTHASAAPGEPTRGDGSSSDERSGSGEGSDAVAASGLDSAVPTALPSDEGAAGEQRASDGSDGSSSHGGSGSDG